MKDYTGLTAYAKCVKCGREIAVTRQFHTNEGFGYETEDHECRYIDKWGYRRNYCKECMSR